MSTKKERTHGTYVSCFYMFLKEVIVAVDISAMPVIESYG